MISVRTTIHYSLPKEMGALFLIFFIIHPFKKFQNQNIGFDFSIGHVLFLFF